MKNLRRPDTLFKTTLIRPDIKVNNQPPLEKTHTETTRYLCAAAHMDENFREYVIENIVHEKYRAIGELYGVDLIAVVKWCFAAQKREAQRDTKLFLLLVILIFIELIIEFFSLFFNISLFLSIILRLVPPIILFLPAWLIIIQDRINIYYGKQTKQLTRKNFRLDDALVELDDKELEERLRSASQNGNVIIYSGYSPFIGSGQNIAGWSFAIDVSKGKREGNDVKLALSFKSMEIYNSVTNAIKYLDLDNMVIEDKLFVNGQCIRDDKRFLDDPLAYPKLQVSETVIDHFLEHPEQNIRHYRCIRLTSWDGELILSIFFRFVLLGNNLFVETDYFVLPPLKEEYYEIDRFDPVLTWKKIKEIITQTLNKAPGLWLTSPRKLMKAAFHDSLLEKSYEDTENAINDDPGFDYGATQSLRESTATTNYRRFFQKLDKEMYVKIITERLLRGILTFLDERNIDTSSLQKREEIILNNGIIVSGNVSGTHVAIGNGANIESNH